MHRVRVYLCIREREERVQCSGLGRVAGKG